MEGCRYNGMQRRLPEASQWMDRVKQQGDEERRGERGKMIGPCVYLQYSFTIVHSTPNMNFNKLSDEQINQKTIKQAAGLANRTGDMSCNYFQKHTEIPHGG